MSTDSDTGRVVLVTGAGSGMGKAIALKFAANGDYVYAMGRRAQPLETVAKQFPKNIEALPVDITDPKSISEAIKIIYKKHSTVHVLVNCAGSAGHIEPNEPLHMALEKWNSVVSVNLNGTFLMTYAVLPLIARPGGRIINVTSLAAFAGSSRAGGEAYSAAKAGVHGMMRTLVRQLAPQGVTVNCVAPGVIEDTEFFGGHLPEDRRMLMLSNVPTGRLGKPDDVAPAVFYLASDEASFVNGDILHVNGGQQFAR